MIELIIRVYIHNKLNSYRINHSDYPIKLISLKYYHYILSVVYTLPLL